MVSIRNKFVVLAAIFWLLGIVFILFGASGTSFGWGTTGLMLTIGIIAQAIGFGFLGYVIMQAVFAKKK